MKHTLRYGMSAIVLAALLAGSTLAWLVATTAGARWLMAAVSRHTQVKITARQVEGRLIGHLRLKGVQIALPRQKAEIYGLELRWQPLLLLAGKVSIEELSLGRVRILDTSPKRETPPVLVWPRVSGIPELLDGELKRLRIIDLTYRRPNEAPVAVTSLSASVLWRNRQLSLEHVDVVSLPGRVTGKVVAGFGHPLLRLDLALSSLRRFADMDRFTLRAGLSPARSPEQLAGTVSVSGARGKAGRLKLTGVLGMTSFVFNLRELRLTLPGRRGEVSGNGTIFPTAHEPVLAFHLKGSDLDLAPELKTRTDLSGNVAFVGTPSRYEGHFSFANRGRKWRAARISGSYRGGPTALKLVVSKGYFLGGTVDGSVETSWQRELSVNGTIRGRNLDPAILAEEWKGAVNFDLTGNVTVPEHAPPSGELNASILESRLHGRALTGEVRAGFSNGNLRIDRLALRGNGFDINAAGELDKRLAFAAEVTDLSRLIPETAGELRGNGWIRRHGGTLDGDVTARGQNLAALGMRLAAAELTVRLGDGKGYPLHAAAMVRGVAYGRFQADTATIEAAGTPLSHKVTVTLGSSGAQAQMSIFGGYRHGSWQGTIASLSGSDGVGPWHQTSPTPFSVSATSVTLAPLVLAGTGAERLTLAAGLTRPPLAGSLRAEWEQVNLARAGQWLKALTVAGSSSGKILVRLQPSGGINASGSATARGEMTMDGRHLPLEMVTVSIEVNEQGSRSAMVLHTPRNGLVRGDFSSSAPPRPFFPEEGRLATTWSGIDLTLLSPWLPAEIGVTGRLAGRADARLLAGKRLTIDGNASLTPGGVHWQRERDKLDATVRSADISWSWGGVVRGDEAAAGTGKLVVSGRAEGTGAYTTDGGRITVQQCSLRIDGDERGTRAAADLSLAGGGSLHGSFSSPSPAGPFMPEGGDVALAWDGIDPALFRPWLPEPITMEGHLSGRADGKLLPDRSIDLRGDVTLAEGRIGGRQPGGELNAKLRSATVSWIWRGEALSGAVDLNLAKYGRARGSFQLPLPARLPAAIDPQGAVQADLTGQVEEKGALTAFFSGMVEESHGELGTDLHVSGKWAEPQMAGSLNLTGGGAYIPSAGIHAKDVQLNAHLDEGLVRIDSFRATSGPGSINGEGVIQLKGWRVAGYRGSVTGERFQAVHLPELQLLSTPRLSFEGTTEKLVVRGEVDLPELLILEPTEQAAVNASKDVVIEGVPPTAAKRFPIDLDVRVRVLLGDNVKIKAAGIDAQLGGSMELSLASLDEIRSKGEIRVVKGHYRAYGLDLEIVRGRLYYAGGPISQPSLDVLALRTIDDVRAGVMVGGVLRAPAIKLYSEPPMTDVDTMAYMVLGHPLGNSSEQTNLVEQAAGALLTTGQSFVLQDQIRKRLGISTLEIQTIGGETSGLMGYRQVQVVPAGLAAPPPTISQSLLTVGKYLTPELYVSYGRSLFTGANLLRLRYDVFRRLQVETQTGSESGVDVYYKIEFN